MLCTQLFETHFSRRLWIVGSTDFTREGCEDDRKEVRWCLWRLRRTEPRWWWRTFKHTISVLLNHVSGFTSKL